MSEAEVYPPDGEAIRERIYRQAEEIRRRELDQALTELESTGDLTESQRKILEAFTDRLTEELLTPVERSLEREQAANADVCRRLFLR